MKRVFLALAAIIINTFLFSCTNETVSEMDQLYGSYDTEGDDADPPPPPPEG
ncbi:hypothetical protein [Pseudozobellia thermophila]|uniref:hypothetical protein n=1 Tax=Pseudozobellia thermophila TaxID=192903 RepID=UPI001479CBAB|nr:hypothetical protein [Pseudozobellia thermophila]